MLNSGKKIRALRDKKKNSNSRVVRKKFYERNKKTYLLLLFCSLAIHLYFIT
jgi:hypothetical protein